MKVECIPLDSFVHGSTNFVRNKSAQVEQSTAHELERAGLVRVKHAKVTPADVKLGTDAGKPQDDGEGQPSSASPAAPASQPPTSQPSGRGGKRRRGRE